MTLKQALQNLKSNQALLHYNIATFEQFKAGIEAVQETRIPLIFGASEGERKYLDTKNIKFWVGEAQNRGLPVFINADHCKSVESSKEAIDNLFDSVLFDLTSEKQNDLNNNILRTKEVKSFEESSRTKNDNKEILIEGEIGYLPGSSDIGGTVELDEKNFTKPEDAENFLQQTGVDLLAISVGNIHGIPAINSMQIDFERIKDIYERTQQFKLFSGLVLHGGSGLTDKDFKNAIKNGIKIVHINTEFRKIWRDSLLRELQAETVVPYKILNGVISSLRERIVHYQKLFLSNNLVN